MDRTVPPANLPEDLVETWQRFDEWRRARIGQGRISDDLWDAAVKAAAKYGVHPTARMLQVDYKCLKRRAEEAAGSAGIFRTKDAPLTFVEVRLAAESSAVSSNPENPMRKLEQLVCGSAEGEA